MSSFTFNGISSETLGLMLTKTPCRPSWTEEKEEVSIPGKSTKLKQGSGVYGNQSVQIETVITDTSKIKRIYEVLSGKGELELSNFSGEYINAEVNPLVPQSVALTMSELTIDFNCSPFTYSKTATPAQISKAYTAVENNGSIYSEPVITFKVTPDAAPILMGDVNFDGVVDARDASLVMNEYITVQAGGESTLTDAQKEAADMNNDGLIDARDASLILDAYTASQSGSTSSSETSSEKQVTIYVNNETLIVGLPSAVVRNGFTVTVDSTNMLIYYTNGDGEKINIMQHSYGDLPLLHTGTNYVKYAGDVDSMSITVNERWL